MVQALDPGRDVARLRSGVPSSTTTLTSTWPGSGASTCATGAVHGPTASGRRDSPRTSRHLVVDGFRCGVFVGAIVVLAQAATVVGYVSGRAPRPRRED